MKKSGKCPKCNSTEIIANAMASGGEHRMIVVTYRKPNAGVFKGSQKSGVSAWVCGACGYIEYYADDPVALKLPKT